MFDMLKPYTWLIRIVVIGLAFAAVISAAMAIRSHFIDEGIALGKASTQRLWDAETAARLAAEGLAVEARNRANEKLLSEQLTARQKEKTDHEEALKVVKAERDAARVRIAANGGLRVDRSICAASSGEGSAAGTEAARASGSGGTAAGTVALPEAITGNLLDLVEEADRVTEQARTCKAFIDDNGFAP